MAAPQVFAVPPAQQPMIIQQMPAQQPASNYNINVRAIKTLGIISIVAAVLLIAFGIAQAILAAEGEVFSTASGIWCGLFILVAGVLGLNHASHPQSGCLLGCNMAFNIVVVVISTFAYGTTGTGIAFWTHKYAWLESNRMHHQWYPENDHDGHDQPYIITSPPYDFDDDVSPAHDDHDQPYITSPPYDFDDDMSRASGGIGVNSTVLILLCFEWAVALITAIFCCTGCCCRPRAGVVIQQGQPMYIAAGVQSSYGQPMVAYGQPTVQYGQPIQYGQPAVDPYYNQQAVPPGYAVQGGVPLSNQAAASGSGDTHVQPLAAADTTNLAYSLEQKEGPPPAYHYQA